MPRLASALAICALQALTVFAAFADPIILATNNGSKGQGWMFGSSTDGTCWITMPQHIFGNEPPDSVVFSDIRGANGEAGPIFFVEHYPKALRATGGQRDLAFAPVISSGWLCLSGLGLHTYAYEAQLKNDPDLQISDLLATSARMFDLHVNQIKVDAQSGLMIGIWPNNSKYVRNMVPGISGAVATIKRSSGHQPFAMVLRVKQERQIGFALRFDAIRTAFAPIQEEWRRQLRMRQNRVRGIEYQIVSFAVLGQAGVVGPEILKEDGGCWKVSAPGGSPTVDLIIANTSKFDSIKNTGLCS